MILNTMIIQVFLLHVSTRYWLLLGDSSEKQPPDKRLRPPHPDHNNYSTHLLRAGGATVTRDGRHELRHREGTIHARAGLRGSHVLGLSAVALGSLERLQQHKKTKQCNTRTRQQAMCDQQEL